MGAAGPLPISFMLGLSAMVAAGEGVSSLPRLMLPRNHAGIRVKRFAEHAPIRRITAVRLPGRYLTPATDRFLALLGSAAAKNADPPR